MHPDFHGKPYISVFYSALFVYPRPFTDDMMTLIYCYQMAAGISGIQRKTYNRINVSTLEFK